MSGRQELSTWLAAVVESYGDVIEDVVLAGSRSSDLHRPDSDWDVVVCLADAVYADPETADRTELAITVDPRLPRPQQTLDLFFLRSSGELIRWEPCDNIGHDEIEAMGLSVIDGWLRGPLCDFSRFLKEHTSKTVLQLWPSKAGGAP